MTISYFYSGGNISAPAIALFSAFLGAFVGFILFYIYEKLKKNREVVLLKRYAKAELEQHALSNPLVDRFLDSSTAPSPEGMSRLFTPTYLPNTLRLAEHKILDPVNDPTLLNRIITLARFLDTEKYLCFYASIESTLQVEGHESSTHRDNVVRHKKEIRSFCREIVNLL
jgi:uncharacterized membrane protein